MSGLLKLRTESVPEHYLNEMHKEFHCFATWMPGIPLQVGDIGEMKHNEFTYISNLDKKGISYTVRTDPSAGSLEHQSAKGITTEAKLSGEAAIPKFGLYFGDAGFIVRFGSKRGVVFQASGVRHQLIDDVISLDNAIAEAYKNGEWKEEWVVISDLVLADSATILIAQGKDAVVGIKAKVQIPELSLANPDAQLQATYKKNMHTALICESGLTPLFKVRGIIRKHWFSDQYEVGGRKRVGQKLSLPPEPPSGEQGNFTIGEVPFTPF